MSLKALSELKANHFEGGSNLTDGGKKQNGEDLASLLNDVMGNANIVKLTSDAGAGGAATENDLAVSGLLAADTILSVSQRVAGANSLPLLGWADQKDGSLDFVYSADPGAGAICEVLVLRALS